MFISFIIPVAPVAKGRARSYRRGNHIGHYTPKKTSDYESFVRDIAVEIMLGKRIIDVPVYMIATFYLPIPKSWSKKKRKMALDGDLMPTSKPDCSNYIKSIEDALNGVIYKDDSQIVDVYARKRYSERPRAEVSIHDYLRNDF